MKKTIILAFILVTFLLIGCVDPPLESPELKEANVLTQNALLEAGLAIPTPAELRNLTIEDKQLLLDDINKAIQDIDESLTAVDSIGINEPSVSVDANIIQNKQLLEEIKKGFLELELFVQEITPPSFKAPPEGKQEFTFEEATQLVINYSGVEETIGNETYQVFGNFEPLPPNTKVFESNLGETKNLIFETDEETFFFWIDTAPRAKFAHTTSFIFVKKSTGEYISLEGSWWPYINDTDYFYPDTVAEITDNLVFGELAFSDLEEEKLSFAPNIQPTRVKCPCDEESEFYAIIIQGDSRKDFAADAENVIAALERQGVKNSGDQLFGENDKIFYLAPEDKIADPDVDLIVSDQAIEAAVDLINREIKCCDTLFFYMSTHGDGTCDVKWRNTTTGETVNETIKGKYCPEVGDVITQGAGQYRTGVFWEAVSVKHTIMLGVGDRDDSEDSTFSTILNAVGLGESGPAMGDYRIDMILDKIQNCNTHIFIDACYSGTAIPALKGPGRTIFTSASKTEVAYGGGSDASPMTGAFIDGLEGAEGTDLDNDGSVSMDEAMQYARDNPRSKNNWFRKSTPQYWRSDEPCPCDDDCDKNDDTSGDGPQTPLESDVTVPPPAGDVTQPPPEDVTVPPPAEDVTQPPPEDVFIPPVEDPPSDPVPCDEAALMNSVIIDDGTDSDGDGIENIMDNCLCDPNPGQEDQDQDNLGDVCDICPDNTFNDPDVDFLCDFEDNCIWDYNPNQEDVDGDGRGDICDHCPTDPLNEIDEDGICVNEPWDYGYS